MRGLARFDEQRFSPADPTRIVGRESRDYPNLNTPTTRRPAPPSIKLRSPVVAYFHRPTTSIS